MVVSICLHGRGWNPCAKSQVRWGSLGFYEYFPFLAFQKTAPFLRMTLTSFYPKENVNNLWKMELPLRWPLFEQVKRSPFSFIYLRISEVFQKSREKIYTGFQSNCSKRTIFLSNQPVSRNFSSNLVHYISLSSNDSCSLSCLQLLRDYKVYPPKSWGRRAIWIIS